MTRVTRALAYFWILLTAAAWLYVSVKALGDPGHTFGVGLVQTEGRAALWFTLPATAAALAGCLLRERRRAAGAWLLVAHGLFWGGALIGGAGKDACERFLLGCELYTPAELFQALVAQAVLAMFFFLVALWAWRNHVP